MYLLSKSKNFLENQDYVITYFYMITMDTHETIDVMHRKDRQVRKSGCSCCQNNYHQWSYIDSAIWITDTLWTQVFTSLR